MADKARRKPVPLEALLSIPLDRPPGRCGEIRVARMSENTRPTHESLCDQRRLARLPLTSRGWGVGEGSTDTAGRADGSHRERAVPSPGLPPGIADEIKAISRVPSRLKLGAPAQTSMDLV
ncbi:hypothetical protein [Brucella anthropi]|uniref:hypothetical protein n=1 Tax=Brucella anthropi TaxID=529 RepID=UPI0011BDE082|nr:hypothetical protein [Brucella anthropi]